VIAPPTANFNAEFDRIDAALEDLEAKIESCQQAIILARAAIFMGLATLGAVLTIATAYGTATVIFGAITAIIAGTVWLGANKSTKEELQAQRESAEARKSELFDLIANQNGWDRDAPGSYH
jgi:ABC-type nickel/cobalt efflux system permease component RcnA